VLHGGKCFTAGGGEVGFFPIDFNSTGGGNVLIVLLGEKNRSNLFFLLFLLVKSKIKPRFSVFI